MNAPVFIWAAQLVTCSSHLKIKHVVIVLIIFIYFLFVLPHLHHKRGTNIFHHLHHWNAKVGSASTLVFLDHGEEASCLFQPVPSTRTGKQRSHDEDLFVFNHAQTVSHLYDVNKLKCLCGVTLKKIVIFFRHRIRYFVSVLKLMQLSRKETHQS